MMANVSIRKGCRQTYRALQINPFETSLFLLMQNTLKIGKKKKRRGGTKREEHSSQHVFTEVMALFNF